MANTRNEIANDLYGCDFDDLSAGEKATVTKRFRALGLSTPRRTARVGGADVVLAKIGKIGNGTKECVMSSGETIQALLNRAGFSYSADKEKITAMSTGVAVELTAQVLAGETYIIAPDVKSA